MRALKSGKQASILITTEAWYKIIDNGRGKDIPKKGNYNK